MLGVIVAPYFPPVIKLHSRGMHRTLGKRRLPGTQKKTSSARETTKCEGVGFLFLFLVIDYSDIYII